MKKRRNAVNGAGVYFDNPQTTMINMMGLLNAAHVAESKLPPEEILKRKEERKLRQEERYRVACITSGECPTCKGKLVRGKKDKKNDYKRSWYCKSCKSNHIM